MMAILDFWATQTEIKFCKGPFTTQFEFNQISNFFFIFPHSTMLKLCTAKVVIFDF